MPDQTAQPSPVTPQVKPTGNKTSIYLAIGIIIVAVIAIVYLLNSNKVSIGGISSPSNPKAAFQQQEQGFSKVKDIAINYSIKVPILTSVLSLLGGSGNITASAYELDNNTKGVISLGELTLAVYELKSENISLVCYQSSGLLGELGSGGVTCQSTNTSVYSSLVNETSIINKTESKLYSIVGNKSVSYDGVKTIAGRGCNDYVFKLNGTQENEMESEENLSSLDGSLGEGSYSYLPAGNYTYEFCMDKQYGYPALINVSVSNYSKLSNKFTNTQIAVVTATGMSTNVDPSVFQVPVPIIINNLECTNDSVSLSFTSFTNSSNSTVDIYNITDFFSSSGPVSVGTTLSGGVKNGKRYVTGPINLAQHLQGGEYYSADACVAGNCQKTDCFVNYTAGSNSGSFGQEGSIDNPYPGDDFWQGSGYYVFYTYLTQEGQQYYQYGFTTPYFDNITQESAYNLYVEGKYWVNPSTNQNYTAYNTTYYSELVNHKVSGGEESLPGFTPDTVGVPITTYSVHAVPYINISSTGNGPNGSYDIGDTLTWYAYVSPDASTEVQIVNASTGSTITFTPNGYADSIGLVGTSFITKSNIKPGLTYLRITDLSTQNSTEASFVMGNVDGPDYNAIIDQP